MAGIPPEHMPKLMRVQPPTPTTPPFLSAAEYPSDGYLHQDSFEFDTYRPAPEGESVRLPLSSQTGLLAPSADDVAFAAVHRQERERATREHHARLRHRPSFAEHLVGQVN